METIYITDNLKQSIERNVGVLEMQKEIEDQKFISLEQDGILKALKGEVTLQDVQSSIIN